MKRSLPFPISFAVLSGLLVAVWCARAEVPVAVVQEKPAATKPAPPRLPYGVEDVLKLSRAQVSEDVIVNYVQSSGTIYSLGAKDIVYLKDEGVSPRVLNAMLDQRKKAQEAEATAQPAPVAQPAPAQPVYAASPAPVTASTVACVQVAPAPEPAPAPSTLHIISYPAARYAYYGPPAYYYRPPDYWYYNSYSGPYRYYGYGPTFSFGIGFGGGYRPFYHCR